MFANLFKGGDELSVEKMFARFTVNEGKKYGQGGYGATYAAFDVEKQEPLAVKVIDTRRMKPEAIAKECRILETLDHTNIIGIKAHGPGMRKKNQSHLYFIFMELASGGELFDQVIDRGTNAMPEEVAKGFLRQLLAGVAHCHSKLIAHRDLKLENVLLTQQGVLKIIDFGLSHVYAAGEDGTADRSALLTDMCGSKSYAAPEVLSGVGYDGFAADVWSIGVSLFAMLSGFFPLDEASAKDWRYAKLQEAQERRRSTTRVVYSWYRRSAGHLSESVISLLDHMLTIDPCQRATMAQVLAHPWVKSEAELDQGSYNAIATMDEEAPSWRGALYVSGADVEDVEFEEQEFSAVYRSLGIGAEQALPQPALARQRPFAPFLTDDADDGAD